MKPPKIHEVLEVPASWTLGHIPEPGKLTKEQSAFAIYQLERLKRKISNIADEEISDGPIEDNQAYRYETPYINSPRDVRSPVAVHQSHQYLTKSYIDINKSPSYTPAFNQYAYGKPAQRVERPEHRPKGKDLYTNVEGIKSSKEVRRNWNGPEHLAKKVRVVNAWSSDVDEYCLPVYEDHVTKQKNAVRIVEKEDRQFYTPHGKYQTVESNQPGSNDRYRNTSHQQVPANTLKLQKPPSKVIYRQQSPLSTDMEYHQPPHQERTSPVLVHQKRRTDPVPVQREILDHQATVTNLKFVQRGSSNPMLDLQEVNEPPVSRRSKTCQVADRPSLLTNDSLRADDAMTQSPLLGKKSLPRQESRNKQYVVHRVPKSDPVLHQKYSGTNKSSMQKTYRTNEIFAERVPITHSVPNQDIPGSYLESTLDELTLEGLTNNNIPTRKVSRVNNMSAQKMSRVSQSSDHSLQPIPVLTSSSKKTNSALSQQISRSCRLSKQYTSESDEPSKKTHSVTSELVQHHERIKMSEDLYPAAVHQGQQYSQVSKNMEPVEQSGPDNEPRIELSPTESTSSLDSYYLPKPSHKTLACQTHLSSQNEVLEPKQKRRSSLDMARDIYKETRPKASINLNEMKFSQKASSLQQHRRSPIARERYNPHHMTSEFHAIRDSPVRDKYGYEAKDVSARLSKRRPSSERADARQRMNVLDDMQMDESGSENVVTAVLKMPHKTSLKSTRLESYYKKKHLEKRNTPPVTENRHDLKFAVYKKSTPAQYDVSRKESVESLLSDTKECSISRTIPKTQQLSTSGLRSNMRILAAEREKDVQRSGTNLGQADRYVTPKTGKLIPESPRNHRFSSGRFRTATSYSPSRRKTSASEAKIRSRREDSRVEASNTKNTASKVRSGKSPTGKGSTVKSASPSPRSSFLQKNRKAIKTLSQRNSVYKQKNGRLTRN